MSKVLVNTLATGDDSVSMLVADLKFPSTLREVPPTGMYVRYLGGWSLINDQTVYKATQLETPRTINGVPFNGTSNITIVDSTKAPIANPTFTGTVNGVSKVMVGLGNVDNTSDAGKPVSTATQTALNLKLNAADFNAYTSLSWSKRSADFTSAVGGSYILLAAINVSLPASPAPGDTVEFTKVTNVIPTILATGGKQIKVKKLTDTSVTYNYDARLLVVFNGTDWEI